MEWEREKKSGILGGPAEGCSEEGGPEDSSAQDPPTKILNTHRIAPTHCTHTTHTTQLAKNGLAKVGLAKVGHDRGGMCGVVCCVCGVRGVWCVVCGVWCVWYE